MQNSRRRKKAKRAASSQQTESQGTEGQDDPAFPTLELPASQDDE